MEVDVSGGEKVEVESPEGEEEDVPPPAMNIKVKFFLVKKCRFCRRYITKSHMVRHIKTVHPNHCNPKSSKTKFQKKSELKLEAKIHKCPSPCKASFERKENLARHQKRKTCIFNHSAICCYCLKGFVTNKSYSNHLANRKCPNQYRCNICNMFFFKLSDLQGHNCTTEE